jgi:hypothetical protein
MAMKCKRKEPEETWVTNVVTKVKDLAQPSVGGEKT